MSGYRKLDLAAEMQEWEIPSANLAKVANPVPEISNISNFSWGAPSGTHVRESGATLPCQHTRTGRRADGTLVCLVCVAVYAAGVWTAQTITYCTTAHVPYHPTPTDGPTRQCWHCPHVCQVPCACGAASWKPDAHWGADGAGVVVWTCRGCGARYGADQVQPPAPPSCVAALEIPSTVWRCPLCHGTRRWRSVYNVLSCATCHPPGAVALVREWLEDGEA